MNFMHFSLSIPISLLWLNSLDLSIFKQFTTKKSILITKGAWILNQSYDLFTDIDKLIPSEYLKYFFLYHFDCCD